MKIQYKALLLTTYLAATTGNVLAVPLNTSQFIINNPSNFAVYYDLSINSNGGPLDHTAWPAGSSNIINFAIGQQGITGISGKIFNGFQTAYCNLSFKSAFNGTIKVSISADSTYSVASIPAGVQGQCNTQ